MPGFLEPDPVILGFQAFRQLAYLEVLLLLALVRAATTRGAARRAALAAALLTAAFVAAKWLPPVLNLSGGMLVMLGGWVRFTLAGMAAPILCTALLLAAAVLPGRRLWGLDVAIALYAGSLFALWGYTIFS